MVDSYASYDILLQLLSIKLACILALVCTLVIVAQINEPRIAYNTVLVIIFIFTSIQYRIKTAGRRNANLFWC